MTTITLAAATAEGAEINDMHFGINATASWQDFGNLKTSIRKLKENGMEVQTIRYPGGVETERFFDITDYDDTYWVDQKSGKERYDFIPMTDFMDYCVEEGIQPVIVIPISNLYIDDGSTPTPNTNMKSALETFVHEAMDMMGDVGVAAFELGNEYWGTMGAAPYGDIASWAAKVVQDAIDDYNTTNGTGPEEPDILVQMWVDPNEDLTDPDKIPMTYEELKQRNLNMIDMFSAEELAAIDGVTAHFYFKDEKFATYAPNTEHAYENLEEVMSHMFEMQAEWEVASGKEIDFYITEWNTHHKINDYTGLKQVAPMLEMFSQYMLNGVDHMQLWAMQFNSAAIADPTGETNLIGDFLILLQDKTAGMQAMDVGFNSPNADVHAFTDGNKAVVFVSSLSDGSQSVDLDFDALFPNVDSYALTSLDIDPDSVDEYYKNGQFDHYGWDEHLEPDAALLEDQNAAFTENPDGSLSFNLDGYQIMMIEFDLVVPGETIVGSPSQNDVLYGTEGDDTIAGVGGDNIIYDGAGNDFVYGGAGKDIFYAGDGSDFYRGSGGTKDEVRFTTSQIGLTIDLTDTLNSTGIAYGDTYWDIERLTGSNFDDLIIGGSGIVSLLGGDGNDVIIDGLVKNALTGGDGADTFRLIAGDGYEERIFDFTLGEDVIDLSLWGVTSLSQLTFTESANGTNLAIIYEDERLRLSGFDASDISAFTEATFIFAAPPLPPSDGVVAGTLGNDIMDGTYTDAFDGDMINGSGQLIQAGDGDDKVYDGAGDDTVEGGAGKDLFYAGAGADAYDGGDDNKDEVLYTTSAIGLTLDLTNTANSTGIAAGDSYINVERLTGSNFDDMIIGGSGIAHLKGADGNDIIIDGVEKNYLTGGAGADIFRLIAGDGYEERIYDFTLGEDVIDLSLWGVTSLSELTITEGANGNNLLIQFGTELVRLNGYTAADIALFTDAAFIFADAPLPPSDGVVAGTSGNDLIDGSYLDALDGDVINDSGQLIQAGDGNDTIYDGAGDDTVEGGNGRDYFYAGSGADAYDGGDDNKDEIWYTTSDTGLIIDLTNTANSTGIAAGDTHANIERLRGTDYDDVITAGSGVTNIKGLGGDDILIDSHAAGKEYFTGGAGADTFRFVSGDGQQDRIYDFAVAEDTIDLSLWGVASLNDLTITEGGAGGHLIIAYGDDSLRVDGYTTADIASFDDSVFIFA